VALVRGDFARLEDLRRRVGDLATPDFQQEIIRRLATTATKLLADEFRDSKDPYGRPWAPVFRNRAKDRRARARQAARGRGPRSDKPLEDTGRLRAATIGSVSVEGHGFRVSIPVEYASYHQYGTRWIKQRQIVPMTETGGIGPIWTEAFNAEVDRAVREKLAGLGGGAG
jgi:phage gpG-like protein